MKWVVSLFSFINLKHLERFLLKLIQNSISRFEPGRYRLLKKGLCLILARTLQSSNQRRDRRSVVDIFFPSISPASSWKCRLRPASRSGGWAMPSRCKCRAQRTHGTDNSENLGKSFGFAGEYEFEVCWLGL